VTSGSSAPNKPPLTPAPTPAERRRRKARRAWIPTIIIGAVIVIAIVVVVLVQIAGVGRVPSAVGDSTFNIAGLRAINGAADVQVDVRTPLSAASVGLPANATRSFGPYDGIELEVDLVGSSGKKMIFVDRMTVVTRNGRVTSITTKTSGSGYLFLRAQLASLSVLGFGTKQMAKFQNAMPDGAGDAHSYFTLPFGVGNALGVPTAVRVSCAGPKGCMITTTTTLHTK
jgi:hypothetical protein